MFSYKCILTRIILIFSLIIITISTTTGQENLFTDSLKVKHDTLTGHEVIDSILVFNGHNIEFNIQEAIEYISHWYSSDLWNRPDDPLRHTMGRLLFEATNDPLFRAEWYLDSLDYEQIKIPETSFYNWDTLHIYLPQRDSLTPGIVTDSLISTPDSAIVMSSDTLFTQQINDSLIVSGKSIDISSTYRDSIVLVISDTLREVISSNPAFPFIHYNYPMTGDSIKAALDLVSDHVALKDSSLVFFAGSGNSVPVWLSNMPGRMYRLWLKNEWDEDVSIWIGSLSRDSVSIIVERGIRFRRPGKETNISDVKINIQTVDNSKLADLKKIDIKPQYWKFLSEANFVFNQAIIKNWSKGGENNISTLLDVTGRAKYTNKEKKMTWSSIGRLKHGLIMTTEYGVRRNIDLIDISSKFNNKAFGKFDFSSTMIFKTQLAKGYKYPDTIPVSKFFNPATLTIGLGLDYKPNKNTSINFAPLSYKGTYVLDTVNIDQTKHGLSADQRSKHEPGMSVQVNHKLTLWKTIKVVNEVRLFTNYIHNPLNVDIDWEMIATAKLNWFTDIRLNTHLIYDDDTLIPVFDDDGEPVLRPDGNQKKSPMIQFKEVIGLSVIFRF